MKFFKARFFVAIGLVLLLSGCGIRPDVFDQAAKAETLIDHQGYALTGGGAGALDSVDGARLAEGAKARITADGVEYFYRLNATSGAAESSPGIISPDSNAGPKRWILQGIRAASLQLASGATPTEFSTDGTLGGNSDVAIPTEKAVKTYVDGVGGITAALLAGYVDRPVFAFKDTDEVYIGAGRYHHSGTAEQLVYWNSQLTFQIGPGGSNAGSSAAPTSGWLHFYIDDSAVVTAGTNLLTASEFVAVTTAPTWSAAKGGYYNGNDRWMFALKTNASAQLPAFYHDGGRLLKYDAQVEDRALADLDTAKVAVTLTIPAICTQALVTFREWANGDSSGAYLYYRTTGSSGNGHMVAFSDNDNANIQFNTISVQSDSSQSIEIWHGTSGAHQAAVYTNGYFLPGGA